MLHGHMCAWPETDKYVWHQRRTIQSARHSKHRCPDPLGSGLTWSWSISWVLYWSRRLWLVCCQMMQPVQMKCWTDSNQNRLCQNIISLSGWMPCRVSLKSWGSVAENVTRAVLKLNQPELLDTYLFFFIYFFIKQITLLSRETCSRHGLIVWLKHRWKRIFYFLFLGLHVLPRVTECGYPPRCSSLNSI